MDNFLNPYEWIHIRNIPGLSHDKVNRDYMTKLICRKKSYRLSLIDRLKLFLLATNYPDRFNIYYSLFTKGMTHVSSNEKV